MTIAVQPPCSYRRCLADAVIVYSGRGRDMTRAGGACPAHTNQVRTWAEIAGEVAITWEVPWQPPAPPAPDPFEQLDLLAGDQ